MLQRIAAILIIALMASLTALSLAQERRSDRQRKPRPESTSLPAEVKSLEALSVILGQPTDNSITANVLSVDAREGYIEYGPKPDDYTAKTDTVKLPAGTPVEILLGKLDRERQYFYRLQYRKVGDASFTAGTECRFHTRRAPGSTFVFGVQGDSHPEREGKMYDPALYVQMMRHVAKDAPDFYITLGDDFSIERLIERKMLTQAAVDRVYAYQRGFLGMIGGSSAVFLVNGNHEQAARCNLDGTADSPAVLAALARARFFSLPVPDAFYGGDADVVKHVGPPRDYYSWTWGDALFVVIDPYWHSAVAVDNEAGVQGQDDGQKKNDGRRRDLWDVTLGDAQYKWLSKTLTESKSRRKFVFSHHVLGTGRGGIEYASLYEWGGRNRRGQDEFAVRRPGWELPIHQLMAKTGVTIFFQGHDHLFARQELDGIIYQSCPNPADPTYTAFNRDAYRSGDTLPNSGHLRVTVSPVTVRVEYVRSYLPKDATKEHPDGEIAFTYEIPATKPTAALAPTTAFSSASVVATGAKIVEQAKDFRFTEGPVADNEGNVYFSDVHASRTYKWSAEGGVKLFRENTGSANGLAFDAGGNLLACEGASGRITAIDAKGKVSVVADTYQGKRFNQPNDLWIDPNGGVYFTDPIYGRGDSTQGGEHVYYVAADRKKVIRVIDDMVRPNGLVGTPDGKTLYVADHGAGKTYRYTINADGTLRDKTLFVPSGSDGMKLDSEGNVYITGDAVLVYDPSGKLIARIAVPQQPTNLCFAGKDRKTLFITARTSNYSIQVNVAGPTPSSRPSLPTRPSEGK